MQGREGRRSGSTWRSGTRSVEAGYDMRMSGYGRLLIAVEVHTAVLVLRPSSSHPLVAGPCRGGVCAVPRRSSPQPVDTAHAPGSGRKLRRCQRERPVALCDICCAARHTGSRWAAESDSRFFSGLVMPWSMVVLCPVCRAHAIEWVAPTAADCVGARDTGWCPTIAIYSPRCVVHPLSSVVWRAVADQNESSDGVAVDGRRHRRVLSSPCSFSALPTTCATLRPPTCSSSHRLHIHLPHPSPRHVYSERHRPTHPTSPPVPPPPAACRPHRS